MKPTVLTSWTLAALVFAGCVGMTPERAQMWGCFTGTFLNIAAKNFGKSYLDDAASLVSVFSASSAAKEIGQQETSAGCRPPESVSSPFAEDRGGAQADDIQAVLPPV